MDWKRNPYNGLGSEQILEQTHNIIIFGSRCIHLEDALARARYIKNEPSASLDQLEIPVQGGVATGQPTIAIYHTHTDESYIPTDGTSTMPGKGSIMLVGMLLQRG